MSTSQLPPPPPPGPGWDRAPWGPRPDEPGAGVPPAPPRELSKAAVASLVFGIIGGCLLGLLFGLIGIRATGDGRRRGRGLAVAGVTLSLVWAVAAVGVYWWHQSHEATRDAANQVSSAGHIPVLTLQVGDCSATLGADGATGAAMTEVDVVPCDQPHRAQVVTSVDLTDGPYDRARIQGEANSSCHSATPSVLAAGTSGQLVVVYPLENSWDGHADRTALCVLVTDTPRTGSAIAGA